MNYSSVKRLFIFAAIFSAASVYAQSNLNWIDGGPGAIYQPGFYGRDSAGAVHSLPMLGALEGREWPASTSIAHMNVAPLDSSLTFASISTSSAARSARANQADNSKDLPSEIPTAKVDPLYYGGEMGVYYGHSIGRGSGDEFGSYIIGSVGNEHLQITVGASYEESNYRLPRTIR